MKTTNLSDTICAVATPAGHSALAIVRLSGADSWRIAEQVCDRKLPKRLTKNGIVFRKIIALKTETQKSKSDKIETIDQAVLLLFKEPKSYTGQDMVEFSVHGSPVVVEGLVQGLIKAGARPAEPGEFTFRAFWNGKMTLDQAEGVASLIAAEDTSSRKGALRLLDGIVGETVIQLQNRIMDVAAKLELMLDFSEEETPVFDYAELRNAVLAIIKDITAMTAESQRTMVSSEGIRIALAGPTNAGKSSLLNRMLARDRVIVSHVPGTTRDVVEAELKISGRKVKIFDTAGLRETRDELEREGVRRSRIVHRDADLVLWVHDSADTEISDEFDITQTNQWLILNKTDLLRSEQIKTLKKQIVKYNQNIFFLSAKTGERVAKLHHAIEEWIEKAYNYAVSDVALPLNQRHLDVFKRTLRQLRKAERMFAIQTEPEILAQELGLSAENLGEITGVGVTENVLNKVFSTFCIGK